MRNKNFEAVQSCDGLPLVYPLQFFLFFLLDVVLCQSLGFACKILH